MTEKERLINKIESLPGVKNSVREILSRRKGILYTSPFYGSSKIFLIKKLFENSKSAVLLLPDEKSINEAKVEFAMLGIEEGVMLLFPGETAELQQKITELSRLDKFILLTTYEALNLRLPPKDALSKGTTFIQSGDEIAYEDFIEYLFSLDFTKERYVEEPGQFAVRGSIIDFWSYSEKLPCRIEFDGDFIESVRFFDPESQRSYKTIGKVSLAEKVKTEKTATLFDYLGEAAILTDEVELSRFLLRSPDGEEENDLERDEELEKELFEIEEGQRDANEFDTTKLIGSYDDLQKFDLLWIVEGTLKSDAAELQTGFRPPPQVNANFEVLLMNLKKYSDENYEIIITTENDIQAQRLTELLREFNSEMENLLETGKVKIFTLPISKGFREANARFLVLTDYEIFNKPYRQRFSSAYKRKRSKAGDLAAITPGDFVVHENYGIGKFVGLETIKIGEVEQESIKIVYADGGVVYVNLNYLGLVKKFASKNAAQPKLTSLGSSEWKRTKKKVKSKIKDAARDLIKLYAARKASTGFAFSPDTVWQKELEASFFYEDTPDQARATEEVKKDMESPNPMDRLVCGDVGFGKTEVAVRAAFKAVNDGKQVCMLVPTTILAEQHFTTFRDRLSQFPVRVEALSRFQSPKEQKEIIEGLKNGTVDIVIGTHRLLSKDVEFKDLGLLIIDEEHRFGVMAKEKLRKMRVNVDTLTLTATPIPRTLNMSLLGARDLSVIATPPPNRQPIYTKVDTFDISKIRHWVLSEVSRGGQVYFVHDRVNSIERLAEYLHKHIPEITIGIAHGKMTPARLEKTVHDFMSKKYDILISTKIIESGIDIPNVNTIIINRADRFGLAELHQLRGRVGRSARQAYAYLLVPSLNAITKKAVRRLQAIEEYSELGEGFNLSMRDLEIRGAGNLLGTEQSGVIETVGFDLYVKLLDEAVDELKREEFKEIFKELPRAENRSQPKIDAYFEVGFPKSFMPDQADRLSYYTALFTALKEQDIKETIEEIHDKFGKPPEMVERLFRSALLRFRASIIRFERVSIGKNKIQFQLPKGDDEDFYKNKFTLLMKFVVEKYPAFKFKQTKDAMFLEAHRKFPKPEDALDFAIEICREFEKEIN
jgi:transcription-repair coupling factor (superfamily II helicase)